MRSSLVCLLIENTLSIVYVLARSVHQPDLNQVDCHWSILSTPLKTYHLTFSGNPLCKYDEEWQRELRTIPVFLHAHLLIMQPDLQ